MDDETGEGSETVEIPLSELFEVKHNTLSKELLTDALECLRTSFKASDPIEKDVARALKHAMDLRIFGSSWHCIVGAHFAASVKLETTGYCFLTHCPSRTHILLFRSHN